MADSPDKILRRTRFTVSSGVLLFLVILISIIIRIWGLDFGLPQRFHPDEPVVVTRAIYGVAADDDPERWNPKAFHWPSLQLYMLGIEYEIVYQTGRIQGLWDNRQPEFASFSVSEPSIFYYLGRLTTVLFAAGCVWMTFLLSRRFLGVNASIFAASMVAIHPILARHGRYITPDILSEFFFLAALYFMFRFMQRFEPENQSESPIRKPFAPAIISAVFTGLAIGTKYPAFILVIPLLVAVLISRSGQNPVKKIGTIIGLGFLVLLVFFITTPYALLDFNTFITDIRTIGWHVQTGHIGMEAKGGIWLSTIHRLLSDSGWVWLVTGITGLLGFIISGFRRTALFTISLVCVLAGLAPLDVFSDRYLIPLIPFLCIGIAWFFEKISTVIISGKNSQYLPLLTAICFILINWQSANVTYRDGVRLNLPDTRTLAHAWVVENIPAHSTLIVEQGGPDLYDASLVPLVPEPWYYLHALTPLFFRGGGDPDPLDMIIEVRPDYVITSSQVRDRYMAAGAETRFPDLVYAFRQYYKLVEEHLNEMVRFTPGNRLGGPEIVVYKVPDGLWDYVVLEEVPPSAVPTGSLQERH